MEVEGPPTRVEGLRRIEAFAPSMGGRYAKGRNHDHGPGAHDGVSVLSPWVRRRLVTERECAAAALDAHGAGKAEKFVQEVFWRTYWKGWLEKRPSVWGNYLAGLRRDRDALASDRRLAKRVAAAEEGRTGIEPFDAWAEELADEGYLHNHARMWFASIWIFTLGLPWRLGADLFMRHLLDGDPASNTLGWRWVGGLHTKGKHYVAADWNIAKFTGNRFDLPKGTLAADPEPLTETFDPGPALPVRGHLQPDPDRRSALLITEEDGAPEQLPLPAFEAAATLRLTSERSDQPVAERIVTFDRGALADAAGRAAPGATALEEPRIDDLVDWAKGAGATQIVTPFVPVGPVRDWLDRAVPRLESAGIVLAELRREWDEAVWPHATAGFFKVKKQIPALVQRIV